MHKLHKLKDQLLDELEQLAAEPDLSPVKLSRIDTLAHALKNLCKLMDSLEDSDDEYRKNSYRGGSMNDASNRKGSYRDNSYRDDSYRGYSRHDNKELLIKQLENLLESADTKSRTAIERCISQVENV